jgi:hypothetical protein
MKRTLKQFFYIAGFIQVIICDFVYSLLSTAVFYKLMVCGPPMVLQKISGGPPPTSRISYACTNKHVIYMAKYCYYINLKVMGLTVD